MDYKDLLERIQDLFFFSTSLGISATSNLTPAGLRKTSSSVCLELGVFHRQCGNEQVNGTQLGPFLFTPLVDVLNQFDIGVQLVHLVPAVPAPVLVHLNAQRPQRVVDGADVVMEDHHPKFRFQGPAEVVAQRIRQRRVQETAQLIFQSSFELIELSSIKES